MANRLDNNTNEVIAIKSVNLEDDSEGIEEIRKEIRVLSTCDSPHIIRYRCSYLVDTKLWIIMDYCALGSLRQFLDIMGPMDESSVLSIAREVLLALSYLHANHIIHRDIKAANILLTDRGKVKLGDFGVASQVLSSFRRNSFVGSPYWMAPEVIKRAEYDSKADIWSFGITLVELLKGSPPLAEVEPGRAIFIIPKSAPPRLDSKYSQNMQDLVNSCLHDDPKKRPSADELLKLGVFRRVKRANADSSLVAIIEQYRQKRRNVELQDRSSILTADDHGTVNSNWTFGTYQSGGYEDRELDRELDQNQEFERETNNMSLGSAGEIGVGTSLPEPNEYFMGIDDPMNLLRLRLDSTSDSFKIDPDSPPKSRSISSTSRNLVSDNSSSTLLCSNLRSKMASNSVINHRKQPSLLSLTFEDDEDSTNFLDELQTRQSEERKKKLQLYDWPFDITDDRQLDAADVYRVMALLKLSLLEIPNVSDPRASQEGLDRHIDEHHRYATKYLELITIALKMLHQASK
jgi:serine/threonine protein kinase